MKLSETIGVRVTPAEYEDILEEADLQSRSMSGYLRYLAIRDINKKVNYRKKKPSSFNDDIEIK